MKSIKAKLLQTTAIIMSCAVLFCGCAKNDDVVMKVNDQEITRAQYWDDFNKIKAVQFKNAPKEQTKETSYAFLSLKAKYTNDVIVRAILSQEFKKRNITASEEEIKDKKEQIIKQMGSEEQFKNVLKENNISDQRLHDDLAQEVQVEKLINALNVKPATDAQALAFYNQNKDKFNLPESVKASHILFVTDAETIKRNITDADKKAQLSNEEIEKRVKEEVDKKMKLANEVLAKAKANPKDFAKLAQQYSEDEVSAKKGGDLGYILKEAVVPEFAQAAFSQKVGTVGPLVKSQFGHHIILIEDKTAAGVQPFDKVKKDIKAYLDQTYKLEAIQKYVDGLKASAKIEFIDESLNPVNIEKQLEEAIKTQIELQQKSKAKDSKEKDSDKK